MYRKISAVFMAVAVLLGGGVVMAEDWVDLGALQAKLAAQEARLNDLQAKLEGDACAEKEKVVADGITSIRKNAVVTVGGFVNTRFFSRHGKFDSSIVETNPGGDPNYQNVGSKKTLAKVNYQQFSVTDAKLEFKIDVNDHFDAYLKMDLQDNDNLRAGTAQNYWIRWKNVCNSGFGLLVGRNAVAYGSNVGFGGVLDNWNLNYSAGGDLPLTIGDAFPDIFVDDELTGGMSPADLAMFSGAFNTNGGCMVPLHNNWDYDRVVQFNPYWESQDGKYKVEASIFEALDTNVYGIRKDNRNGSVYNRAINFGFGSFSARVTAKPVEGLTLSASFMSLGASQGTGWWSDNKGSEWLEGAAGNLRTSSRSNGIQTGFEYTPSFFDKLTVWAQYGHGWNDYWIQDYRSDSVNYGLSYKITDALVLFGQGDYLSVKNGQGNLFHKASGWAAHGGLQYTFPYGVSLEAGYRHEHIDYKDRQGKNSGTYKSDTGYMHVGFEF